MKPAFKKITINGPTGEYANGSLTIEGPIDFKEGEGTEAYFWVRVTRGQGAEALGDGEMDIRATQGAAEEAKKLMTAALGKRSGGKGAVEAISEVSPMWHATIAIKKPPLNRGRSAFAGGQVVAIEAWARISTDNPKRTFQIYWKDDKFTI